MRRRRLAAIVPLLLLPPPLIAQSSPTQSQEPVILSAVRNRAVILSEIGNRLVILSEDSQSNREAQSKDPEGASTATTAQTFPTTTASPKPPNATDLTPAPLPDIQTLLARVRTRYDALESLRRHYICTITQVADEFSSNGTKKTHTDVYQAFFVNNIEVQQHIARDGKPLSPKAAKKEQQRVDKLIAKLKAHDDRAGKDDIHLSAGGLLKVATFTRPRRELIANRPTLIFDYTGNPGAKAPGLSDQIMRALAGTLWIDERDSAILRLTGHLQQNFHIAGGLLVNIKSGSWFDFTQTRVNNEIWFPRSFTAHVDGRFLLVKGFNGNAHDTFSDYRKLETTVTLRPGSHVFESPENVVPSPSSEPPKTTPQPQQNHQN